MSLIPSFMLPQKLATELLAGALCCAALFGSGWHLGTKHADEKQAAQHAKQQQEAAEKYQQATTELANVSGQLTEAQITLSKNTVTYKKQADKLVASPKYAVECLPADALDLVNKALEGETK